MLLRAPASWPTALVAAVAMLLLAVVDLGAAYATKEAVVRRSLPWAVAGVALFVLLFYVYASSLQYAELALVRSEEHTSELQSRQYLVCRLLLEKKKKNNYIINIYSYNTMTLK